MTVPHMRSVFNHGIWTRVASIPIKLLDAIRALPESQSYAFNPIRL